MQKFLLKSTMLLIVAAIGFSAAPSWAGESRNGDSRNEGVKRDNISQKQIEAISRHYDSPGKKAGLGRLLPRVPSFGCK